LIANQSKVHLFERLLLVGTLFLLMNPYTAGFGAEQGDNLTAWWPQWRGPDGLGVSSEQNLPEIWNSNSHNIRWKTTIPGEGVSSPIVSNGRVILTTAYESQKAVVSQKFIAVASSGLVFIFFTGAVVGFLRKRRERTREKISPAVGTLPGRFNVLLSWFTSFVFICFALLVTVARQHSDLVFGRFGLILSRLGLVDIAHLCSMAEGVKAAVWLTSGGIALFGLAVCVGWLRAHGHTRSGDFLAQAQFCSV